MQTIITPALTLEPLLASHADEMFALLSDDEIYRYLDYAAPASADYLRGVYQRLESRRSPDAREAWLNWVIRPLDQPLAGYVQATVEPDRSAYVAYVLGSRYWGHGYAQRAVQAMLDHLVSAYSVDRFLATVEADNQRSIRLLERLGFHPIASHELDGHQLSTTERMFMRSWHPTEAI
jgi:[ribosomal protein S5]-alanine N-acetyltransferase